MKTLLIALLLLLGVSMAAQAQYNPQPLPNPTTIHGAGGCTPNWSTGGCL